MISQRKYNWSFKNACQHHTENPSQSSKRRKENESRQALLTCEGKQDLKQLQQNQYLQAYTADNKAIILQCNEIKENRHSLYCFSDLGHSSAVDPSYMHALTPKTLLFNLFIFSYFFCISIFFSKKDYQRDIFVYFLKNNWNAPEVHMWLCVHTHRFNFLQSKVTVVKLAKVSFPQ